MEVENIQGLQQQARNEAIELKATLNEMLVDFEKKYQEIGVVICPITSTHKAFNNNDNNRIQLLGLSYCLSCQSNLED